MHVGDVQALTQNSLTSSSSARRTKFTQQDFLKLLVAELTRQDPLEPLNSNDFMQQITSIHNLEAITTLTESLKAARKFEELSAASSLIGRTVRGYTIANLPVEGKVDRVSISGDGIYLIVNGRKMSLGGVVEIFSSHE